MNSFSYWDKTSFLENYDIIIAGSGIVGLHAAWNLKKTEPKLNVLVLERGSIPSGASTRNAGVACFGTMSEILDDLKNYSENEVFTLIEKRWNGLQLLKKNLGIKKIQFESLGGFELFRASEKLVAEKCLEKIGYINKQLSPILGSFTTYKSSPNKINKFEFNGITHLIENVAEAQIDSGKMMAALTQKAMQAGVFIFTGTEVDTFDESGNDIVIRCKNGIHFRTKKFLIATNGFAKKLIPQVDVIPARAQVIVTSEIQGNKIKGAFHFDQGYYFFRNIGDRILFGGGRNLDFKTEKTMEFGFTEKVQKSLELHLREMILPNKKFTIEHRWSGIMGMGSEKLPIIQKISPHVFCAVRLSGMGVAIGAQSGADAAEMVLKNL